jgi:hypothetical protein
VPYEVVITTTFGTSQGPTQPLMVNWTRFRSPPFPPFTLQPFHRNLGEPPLDIAATAASADRNLPDYEAPGLERTIYTRVRHTRPIPVQLSHHHATDTQFAARSRTHRPIADVRGNNLVEFRMKANSEVT